MRKCDITGKGTRTGHNVSFSNRHTKTSWQPNLQTKRVMIDGKMVKLKVSAHGIKILKKKGIIKPYSPAAAK
jgi:large subunit ribosomal protein L28